MRDVGHLFKEAFHNSLTKTMRHDVIIILTHITSHMITNSNSFRIYLAKYVLFDFVMSIFINTIVITTRRCSDYLNSLHHYKYVFIFLNEDYFSLVMLKIFKTIKMLQL
jgi:hypothetical protein